MMKYLQHFGSYAGILALAISYVLMGKLSLMLAIPPGYSTAVFPSAGIAVAALLIWGYRIAPGVFLGSLLLNIWVSVENSSLSTISVSVAALVAIGATLQSLIGVWLVRRFVDSPTTLTQDKGILLFMLLAGPIACLVNASVGISGLLAFNIIESNQFAYSWFTWWIGDSIGVMIAAPLMFCAFYASNKVWQQRRSTVAIPLIFMLTLIIFLFIGASKWESDRLRSDFSEVTVEAIEKLNSSFSGYLDAIASIERYFVSTPNVTRQGFRTFVKRILETKPGIQGLSWNPLVLDGQRSKFERSGQEEGFTTFSIKQRSADGKLMPAVKKAQYLVVHYIEPLIGNEKALGFDVSSNPERLQAINKARITKQPVATGRINLVQENENQAGFLFFYPVFKNQGQVTQTSDDGFEGLAVGVFRIGDIVSATLAGQGYDDIEVGIYDESAQANVASLYGPQDPAENASALFHMIKTIEIGGRQWSVHFWTSQSYLSSHQAWQAWAILAMGLLFTSMLGAFLLAMTGRSYQLNIEVLARTQEIQQQKIKLIEINDNLANSIKELENSNQELDQYAFIASHDLKSPLQAIFQLTSWIEDDCSDILPSNSKRHLKLLKERTKRMETLLADLLVFSRINRDDYKIEVINIKTLAEKAYSFNSISSQFVLKLENCDIELSLPRIPVELALRNLIGNAAKHHDKNAGIIIVSYQFSDDEHIISVADDGPGIPEHLQSTALKMFSTLKSRDEVEGSGLGLAIVKKAVERFGGKIILQSDGIRGTRFSMHWPSSLSKRMTNDVR